MPKFTPEGCLEWLRGWRDSGERRCLVLQGPSEETVPLAHTLQSRLDAEARGAWIGAGSTGRAYTAQQASGLVGQEHPLVVWNALDQGFHAEGFCAVAGTLVGGGLLLLLWPDEPAGIMAWWGEQLRQQRDAVVWCNLTDEGFTWPLSAGSPGVSRPDGPTPSQQQVIAAVGRVLRGHRRRPLVVTADRGRGKSAALGMAAAALIQGGDCRIIVTAPSKRAVATLFAHAAGALGVEDRGGALGVGASTLRFVAPDALCRDPVEADLVLVDEAAALPVALLKTLLARHARIVFATTVHGYEVTGRGFELRFKRHLEEMTPQWRALTLHDPIRWASGDPLEAALNAVFLLDAESPAQVPGDGALRIGWTCPAELRRPPSVLREAFALLVLAHYQTSPADLQWLVEGDAPIGVCWQGDRLVGVLLISLEGGLSPELAHDVRMGHRRPAGHLLPQSLTFHGQSEAAGGLRWARIQRLAVHPAARRQGIGRALLAAAREQAAGWHVEALGASFGFTTTLLRFWSQVGYQVLRVGISRDAATGEHALMVGLPVSLSAGPVLAHLRTRFTGQLPVLLAGPLSALEVHRVSALAGELREDLGRPGLSDAERCEGEAFAFGHLPYELAEPVLARIALPLLANDAVSGQAARVLVRRVLQRVDWAEVAREAGLAGRKAVETALRAVAACAFPDETRARFGDTD